MERPETVTERGETMNCRCVWVVEIKDEVNGWMAASNFFTRLEARLFVKQIGYDKRISRVVKYVPADTSKKAGEK